ncbi:class I SAM-dependent methyltransferase [Hyphobacterium sp.]|uniref:class I SAM-dependent methyltransferase n=1 Tax=Hyphobacterium sp. TaxID=2004662 RepID=UPI003BADAFF1
MPKRVDANPPFKPKLRYALYQCESCGTLHYPDAEVFEYESRRDADLARKFYLEVGAGLDAMIAPLAWAGMENVSSYLEVGGGYGFSVDFAARELGWDAANIDPSFLAQTGARDLGHRHIAAYLSPDHALANASFDRVLSSEVIEHVSDPDQFIQTLDAALAPNGVLMLTTPNANVVRSGASLDELLPVITAGHHLIIFSEAGLKSALKRAGYAHVHVKQAGATLYAVASHEKIDVKFDARPDRARLQTYLKNRLETLGDDHALFSAFAVRLLKECVHTANWEKAGKIRDKVATRWLNDFGFDINRADGINPVFIRTEKGQRTRLRKFAANYPFSLAIALYYSGRIEQNSGNISSAIAAFRASARAARTLQSAFTAMFAACRETEEAGLRSTLASAELEASSHPDAAVHSLLSVADLDGELLQTEWSRIACHVYAANALSGQSEAVEAIEPFVRGQISARIDQEQGLDTTTGYAAGGLGETALQRGQPDHARRWFKIAADAMNDPAEELVFTRKAAALEPKPKSLGDQLVDALNSEQPEDANEPARTLLSYPVEHPEICRSTAFGLGIYSLNIKPDATAAVKWFARAAELSVEDQKLDAEFHLALAANRLPDKERDLILPDLLRKLEKEVPENSDLNSRVRLLADRYRAETGLRETHA